MRAKAAYGNDEMEALAEFEGRVNADLDAFEKSHTKK
jgi:hypothetical protein